MVAAMAGNDAGGIATYSSVGALYGYKMLWMIPIMTLLLIMEQLDSGQLDTSDIVTASAQASSMGGSQIWLKEGEQMSVDEMLKCIAVNSANDCAVAMAEHISGSE